MKTSKPQPLQCTKQFTSYHHTNKNKIHITNATLTDFGFSRGTAFNFKLDNSGNTLVISVDIKPNNLQNTLLVTGDEETPTVIIDNLKIKLWLSSHKGFWVHYRDKQLAITRLSENMGPCAKQNVVATISTRDGNIHLGTNQCLNPQNECPRDTLNLPSGEGYELCVETCKQTGHAEANALKSYTNKNNDAIMHLEGHYYACNDCTSKANKAGFTKIFKGSIEL
jgi:deoxycytidylate deaminase